jgi:hypothetical protein
VRTLARPTGPRIRHIGDFTRWSFRIARLDEPRPEAIVAREQAWLRRWHEHAPLGLFVSARKA